MRPLKQYLSAAVISCLIPISTYAIVCRLALISGAEKEYHAARAVIGNSTTAKVEEMKVYLTVMRSARGDLVYAHSNYVSEGATYPTKIAEPIGTFSTIDEVVSNLVYTDIGSYRADTLDTKSKLSKIEVFATSEFFDEYGEPVVDIQNIGSARLVEDSATIRLLPNQTRGPPPYLARLSANTRAKYTPKFSPTKFAAALSKAQFNKDKLAVLNLIEETPVEEAMRSSSLSGRAVTVEGTLSEESLLKLIEKNRGRCLTALFHSDGENIVVMSPAGEVVLKMALEKVSEAARRANCAFIGLGCSSAKSKIGIGALDPFDPVKALECMRRAMDAKNFGEFSELLAGGNFRLVFDPEAIQASFLFEGFAVSEKQGRAVVSQMPSINGIMVPRSN